MHRISLAFRPDLYILPLGIHLVTAITETQMQEIPSLSDALRIHEILKMLPKMSRSTFWRLRKTGNFPKSFHIMGNEYWHKSDVEKWIAEVSQPAAA